MIGLRDSVPLEKSQVFAVDDEQMLDIAALDGKGAPQIAVEVAYIHIAAGYFASLRGECVMPA